MANSVTIPSGVIRPIAPLSGALARFERFPSQGGEALPAGAARSGRPMLPRMFHSSNGEVSSVAPEKEAIGSDVPQRIEAGIVSRRARLPKEEELKRGWAYTSGVLLGGCAALAAYAAWIRKWHLRWGATDEEIARAMPLDEEVSEPTYVTNRAITIEAGPEEIWPWIAQMGELPRGGFYSYLTVERLLRMKVANAEQILPEFQNPNMGDALDRAGRMLVKAVTPGRMLVLGPPPMPDLQVTWAIGLYPAGDKATRLVSRCRARLARDAKGILTFLMLDPGQFLMERKMLLELKRRAESLADAREETPTLVKTAGS
jgi:hypothetical protein